MKPSEKQKKCRYAHRYFGKNRNETHCVKEGRENDKVKTVSNHDCDNCDKYKSKYIEYPLTIKGIENKKMDTTGISHDIGCFVEIKPCNEKYENKTFLGIYLGNLPIQIISRFNNKTEILENSCLTNPAIFVPELKEIIYGCESYWREIENIQDFKDITEEDINNTWYIQLLKNNYPQNVDNSVDNKIEIKSDYYLIIQTKDKKCKTIKENDLLSKLCIKLDDKNTETYQNVTVMDITKRQLQFMTQDETIIDINISDITKIKKASD